MKNIEHRIQEDQRKWKLKEKEVNYTYVYLVC